MRNSWQTANTEKHWGTDHNQQTLRKSWQTANTEKHLTKLVFVHFSGRGDCSLQYLQSLSDWLIGWFIGWSRIGIDWHPDLKPNLSISTPLTRSFLWSGRELSRKFPKIDQSHNWNLHCVFFSPLFHNADPHCVFSSFFALEEVSQNDKSNLHLVITTESLFFRFFKELSKKFSESSFHF